jgi:hypothetical protein
LVSGFSVGTGLGTLSGTVTSWVVADPANTTFPGGGLTFYYQVNNTSPGSQSVERLTTSGFGFLLGALNVDVEAIAVGYAGPPVSSAGGTAPASADRGTANTIGWNFVPGAIAAGGHSELLVVHTSATRWAPNDGAVIDGKSANVTILAPTPVPEPTTMIAGALLLLPFGASTLRFMRKTRAA